MAALRPNALRLPAAETLLEILRQNRRGVLPTLREIARHFRVTVQDARWRVRPLLSGKFVRRIGRGVRGRPARYEVIG